jgi:hypothetical protein
MIPPRPRGWDVLNARSLAEEPIVRLILDGTAVALRLHSVARTLAGLNRIDTGVASIICAG